MDPPVGGDLFSLDFVLLLHAVETHTSARVVVVAASL